MKNWVAFPLLLGFLLAACTTQIPTPSQAEIVFMAAQTVASNQDVSYRQHSGVETDRIQKSPTPTLIPPAENQTPIIPNTVNIATQIAMPKQGSGASRLYGLSILDNGSLLVTVEFSPLPEGSFSAMLGQDSLQCNTLPENRNRIYCHGIVSRYDLIQSFRLYQEESTTPVFISDLWIPAIPQEKLLSSTEELLMKSQESTPKPSGMPIVPDLNP